MNDTTPKTMNMLRHQKSTRTLAYKWVGNLYNQTPFVTLVPLRERLTSLNLRNNKLRSKLDKLLSYILRKIPTTRSICGLFYYSLLKKISLQCNNRFSTYNIPSINSVKPNFLSKTLSNKRCSNVHDTFLLALQFWVNETTNAIYKTAGVNMPYLVGYEQIF